MMLMMNLIKTIIVQEKEKQIQVYTKVQVLKGKKNYFIKIMKKRIMKNKDLKLFNFYQKMRREVCVRIKMRLVKINSKEKIKMHKIFINFFVLLMASKKRNII